MWVDILLAIIPIFVAIDIVGIIPVYLSLTGHTPASHKERVLRQSVLTALLVSLVFLVLGRAVFTFLGITMSDFKIAGGIILFAIAINDLLFSTEERKSHEVSDETTEMEVYQHSSIGIVPIGIPLIVGPALLTTILISLDSYGLVPTVSAVVINLLIVYVGLKYSGFFLKIVGRSGAKGIAKVFTLLLGAIGVMMVRTGIMEIVKG
jgi:multiple antibiotic resistance protein